METDKQLYRLFQEYPAGVFELTGLPAPGPCALRSFTLKALQRTADGLIVPDDPSQPLTVVEFQFKADRMIYTRLVTEMAAVQEAHDMRPVQGIVVFRFPHLDPHTKPWDQVVHPFQLRDLIEALAATQPDHPLVAVFQPVLLTNPETLQQQAVQCYRRIKQSTLADPVKATLTEIFLSWLEQRLPHLGRKELTAMFVGELTPLEETQLGKELIQLGREQGEARGMAQGIALGGAAALRAVLLRQLSQRFGAVPAALAERIAQADLDTLQAACDQVFTLQRPDDLRL